MGQWQKVPKMSSRPAFCIGLSLSFIHKIHTKKSSKFIFNQSLKEQKIEDWKKIKTFFPQAAMTFFIFQNSIFVLNQNLIQEKFKRFSAGFFKIYDRGSPMGKSRPVLHLGIFLTVSHNKFSSSYSISLWKFIPTPEGRKWSTRVLICIDVTVYCFSAAALEAPVLE